MKTPRAESVIAADDRAFLDRLWQDSSPGYDAAEDLRKAKQCLRDPRNLSAAIAHYQAEEPGLHAIGATDLYAAEHAALLRIAPQPTLYLHGRRDGCVDVALVADAERHLASGSRMDIIEDAATFPTSNAR